MPRTFLITDSFNGGEISDRMYGHVSFEKRKNSLRRLQNQLSQKHGPAFRRPGTYYVCQLPDPDREHRMEEFEFNRDQTYALLFGHNYARFFSDQGIVETSPGSEVHYQIGTSYPEDELFDLRFAHSADVLYIAHPNHPPAKLQRNAHASWSIVNIDFKDGPYGPINDESDHYLNFSNTTGTVTVNAVNHSPFTSTDVGRLIRAKEGTAWSWLKIIGYSSPTQVTATIKGPNLQGTGNTADWRLGAWGTTTGYPAAVAFHQGRLVWGGGVEPQKLWFSKSNDFETHSPSSLEAGGDIGDADGIVYDISEGQIDGIKWISSGKVLMVGTSGAEHSVTGSESGVLTPTTTTSNLETPHGSSNVSPQKIGRTVVFIQAAGRKLRELNYDFGRDQFFSPDLSLLGEHLTLGGIKDISYEQEPDSILWLTRNDGLLNSFTYDREQNVLSWARHPLGGKDTKVKTSASILNVKENRDETWLVAERKKPDNTIRKDVVYITKAFDQNSLKDEAFFVDFGLTYDEPISISDATQANPVVITANSHGFLEDDLVKIVKVKGMTEINDESFIIKNVTTNTFELYDLDENPIDGSAFTAYEEEGEVRKKVSTITGLDHLEGETVRVLVDGAVHPEVVVASGQIDLENPAAKVHAGLGYRSILQPFVPEIQLADGTSEFRPKRIVGLSIRVAQTLGLKFGRDLDNLDFYETRSTSDVMDDSPGIFSGDLEVDWNASWEGKDEFVIVQDDPLPMTVQAISVKLDIHNG